MKHKEETIYRTAHLHTKEGEAELQLFLDSDNRFRWYRSGGASTYVSGKSVGRAMTAAIGVWGISLELHIGPSPRKSA